ncbi:hypothetical protein GCM10007913_06940 [Devosia yakushimensis]|uniref:Solute-binding protein family 3/N-terminal domain-containing protein n=1 Tax=Devosia yakushimensis TaxID=470028 RepID=A0ABQ5U9F0_9HYPH|nr:transporter substrate-binding domain-containing protein [Devosia yakushimensis]GLQ08762.1 hypothetical protein GCM10007913_06940 [Devosia yakushimensis]
MKRYLALLLGAVLALLCTGAAQAQRTFDIVPRDLYTDQLRQNGNSITFCYNPDGMAGAFEKELAETIGSVLLVDVELYPINNPQVRTHPLDYRLPYIPEQIFVLLAENCDAMLGYVLSRNAPDWVLLTRPYLSTGNVLVTRNAELKSLADLPLDQAIGSRSLSLSDNRLLSYLRALPADKRWVRQPFYDNQKVLDRLNDGRVGAAVIWEPALYFATAGDPEAAGYHLLPLAFPDRRTDIGIVTRSNNTYLNGILGEAIGELISDGTLAEMVDRYHLGPTSVPQ